MVGERSKFMIVVDMEKAFRISLIINIILFILFGVMTVLFITKKTECPKTNQKYGLKNIVIDEANISFKNDQYTYDVYLEDDIPEPEEEDANQEETEETA